MAKNKISEWSSTAANNTDIGGIDIAEGCAPSGINNAIRELMAQVKDQQSGTDADNFTVGGNLSVTGTSTLTGAVTAPAGVTANVTGNLTGNASTATTATSATTATKATNIAGGGAGQVPYNSGADTTAFLAAGTAGRFLQSNGTSAPAWAAITVSTLETAKATTSGTSVEFTSIPAGTKRITFMLNGVSTNGSSDVIVQIGDSGGYETTGYLGSTGETAATGGGTTSFTTGIGVSRSTSSSSIRHGIVTLTHMGSNLWAAGVSTSRSDGAVAYSGGSNKTLSAELDRIKITTVNGTDAFDAGSVNILYE